MLGSVACSAIGSCEAIGGYSTSDGPQDGLIATLSDGTWTVIEDPVSTDPPSGSVSLEDLACPAPGSCVAVGVGQTNGAVAEVLSDGTWTATTVWGADNLSELSCPAVGICVAVGIYGLGTGSLPTVETLAGGVWTPTTAPVPPNGGTEPSLGHPNPSFDGGTLWSVSCATVASCMALGQYFVPTPTDPWCRIAQCTETLIETLGLGGAQAPVISSPDQATFTVGQSGTFTVTASGPTAPAISEKGKLPKGLHFKTGVVTATIEGKPSKKTGTYSLTITATSPSTNERVAQPFVLTVNS